MPLTRWYTTAASSLGRANDPGSPAPRGPGDGRGRQRTGAPGPVPTGNRGLIWLKRAPFDGGAEVEIRQVFEAEDFGEAMTPELREREDRLRARTEELSRAS